MTKGRLCGRIARLGQSRRRPSSRAMARAAAPALVCTTVPPAKSSAPRRAAQPVGEKTQFATGAYTTVDQTATNATNAANRQPAAVAPLINAGEITAHILRHPANPAVRKV